MYPDSVHMISGSIIGSRCHGSILSGTARRQLSRTARACMTLPGSSTRRLSSQSSLMVSISQKFQATARAWTPPRILSVGRVVYQKGYDVALDALVSLKDLEWEWHIVGDGPHLDALRAMLEKYGLEDRVHFMGWEAANDVKLEYARANLFLHPSRHEGMPNAVLEAMASGLPVIATRIAGNEELVLDTITGLLVPNEDPAALGIALRQLLVETDRRHEMGMAARRRVEQSFGWKRVAEEYKSILEKAIQ